MFRNVILCIVGFLTLAGITMGRAAADPVRVMALSATSSKDAHFDLASLLDSSATTGWQPGLSGSGAEEGVLLEFEKPVKVDEIQLSGTDTFKVSLNGRENDKMGNEFKMKIPVELKSLFIHVASRPKGPSELKGFKLLRNGNPIELQKPLIVRGEVTAQNVLEPFIAYGPFRLFDSKIDMAFAMDGNKINPSAPIPLFDLTFPKSLRLKGFYIWNGYQRSNQHYYSNARPEVLTVASGGQKAQFPLKDDMGAQWVAFPGNGWDASSLHFTADKVYPGTTYKDLVVSEISFVTEDGQTLLVDAQKPVATVSKEMTGLLDQSFKSYPDDEYHFDIKFRSDGTFAAFQHKISQANTDRCIYEGNWEMKDASHLRVFGRYYETSRELQAAYGVGTSTEQSGIFQTQIQVTSLDRLTPSQKKEIYDFEKDRATLPDFPQDEETFWKAAKEKGGMFFIKSNLFSQIMVADNIEK